MTLNVCVLMTAGLAMAAPAMGSLIAPGGTLFLSPAGGTPVGTVVASATLPFATSLYSGTLTSQVISGDASNPWVGSGGLTFTFRLENNAVSQNALARLTVNGWTSWLTDAFHQAPLTGFDPLFIDRQAGAGDSLGFSFSNALGHSLILPGTSSTLLVIQTNATAWTTNIANVIDGAVTQVGTFSPIPTPGAAALAGLGALAACRRRR